MADINTEKAVLRTEIITAAKVYKKELAGNVYLYVIGDEYFEVAYKTECFKHLTGVESPLSGKSFYNNAKNATLTTAQISFNARHPLKTAKKKVVCLQQLPRLTQELVCAVKDLSTITITYKLGITNLEFTVGLTENLNTQGVKINDWLIPRTLRVRDKSIESSTDAEFVDFIFMKRVCDSKYTTLCYEEPKAFVPDCVRQLLSDNLLPLS